MGRLKILVTKVRVAGRRVPPGGPRWVRCAGHRLLIDDLKNTSVLDVSVVLPDVRARQSGDTAVPPPIDGDVRSRDATEAVRSPVGNPRAMLKKMRPRLVDLQGESNELAIRRGVVLAGTCLTST